MTTKREKGLAFQRYARDWLKDKGWVVHNQTPSGKMIVVKGKKIFVSKANDIFGCVDLVAKKEQRKTLWIQATLDSGLQRKKDDLLEVPWNISVDIVQIWVKRKTGIIDIFLLISNDIFIPIGKIIRKKFFCSEGMSFEF